MQPTALDGIILIYNFAVVLSGAYAAIYFGIQEQGVMFGTAFVIAIVWTVYFRYGMLHRITPRVDPSQNVDS